MTLFLGIDGLSKNNFFSKYWRQRPFCSRNNSKLIQQFCFSNSDFEHISEQLETLKPDYVKKGGDGVIFLQNINLVSNMFCEICDRWSTDFGLINTWFDSVRTQSGSCGGIGSHFDHSDNFVFQIEGVKTWRLHPPSAIPLDDIRRRMRGEPGVGSFDMPTNAMKFVLQPGDILYIPLLWLHEGVSEGESLSLSLVSNTNTAFQSLLPLLASTLANVDLWWDAMPIPAEAEQVYGSVLFDEFFEVLDSKEFREILKRKWIESIPYDT